MRIAHVTTVHRWDDGRIFERQARSLQRAGHEVFVLAPGAETQRVDNVDVVPLGIARRRSDRMLRLVREAQRQIGRLQPDVVIVHDPELLRLVTFLSFRRCHPALVYDAHEDYSAQMRDKEWLPKWSRTVLAVVLGKGEQLAALRANAVLAATPVIAKRFRRERTFVVLNRPVVSDLPEPRGPRPHLIDGRTRPSIIAYVGELSEIRGARTLLEAMSLLVDLPETRLCIAGRIRPSSLEHELRGSEGWSRVDFVGWLPRHELSEFLNRADVAVVPFLPTRNHVHSQPNKLFEYAIMGLPIVMSNFETWKELVDDVNARYETFTPGVPGELAEALRRVLSEATTGPSHARAERARQSLGWEQISRHYVNVVEAAAMPQR